MSAKKTCRGDLNEQEPDPEASTMVMVLFLVVIILASKVFFQGIRHECGAPAWHCSPSELKAHIMKEHYRPLPRGE